MKILALPIALFAALGVVSSQAQTVGPVTVVNYAGFSGQFPVAPGSIASAYGDFGAVATTSAPSLSPMPREIAGLRIRINSVDAPLYFVSRAQLNLVIPVGTPTGRQPVEVVSGGTAVARGFVQVYEIGPALASSDTTPARQGIVQNQNFAVNSSGARARRGETIQIYATGCGAVTPAVQDGTPPTALSSATAQVKVYVSVDEAPVSFAGAHPLFPGVCQINAVIPNMPYITGQVPIYFTANGVNSNPVTIWVE